mmetsp:Transcript_45168/g.115564  ORF Transcript_45168/g.115564 Transcript_45168/m.115564 type:complete len:233 (-) Transcript_45168:163-861(-)
MVHSAAVARAAACCARRGHLRNDAGDILSQVAICPGALLLRKKRLGPQGAVGNVSGAAGDQLRDAVGGGVEVKDEEVVVAVAAGLPVKVHHHLVAIRSNALQRRAPRQRSGRRQALGELLDAHALEVLGGLSEVDVALAEAKLVAAEIGQRRDVALLEHVVEEASNHVHLAGGVRLTGTPPVPGGLGKVIVSPPQGTSAVDKGAAGVFGGGTAVKGVAGRDGRSAQRATLRG